MIALIVSYVLMLSLAAIALIKVRKWLQSGQAAVTLAKWPPKVFIPVQILVALAWIWGEWLALWYIWFLKFRFDDPWWSFSRAAILVFWNVFVPGIILLISNSWLRLHRLPPAWTLQRIWMGSAILISPLAVSTVALPETWIVWTFSLFFIALLFALFLTRWWVLSHPIPKSDPVPSRRKS